MTEVASSEQTIYSYENTFVAEVGGRIVGAMCAYDGADYERLKQPVVDILGTDSGFAQLKETEEGEFYLDSVGVIISRVLFKDCHIDGIEGLALISYRKLRR